MSWLDRFLIGVLVLAGSGALIGMFILILHPGRSKCIIIATGKGTMVPICRSNE